MASKPDPVHILMILDGWGINTDPDANAAALADTPFLDMLVSTFPKCELTCSGNSVGLPEGTMGNSEVGHMNIGAGRIVPQDFVRINTAIRDRSFFDTPALKAAMTHAAENNTGLHLMGLLSDGGVHSHISHLFALIEMAGDIGVQHLFIHPILDGRDTSPTSGVKYLRQLETFLADTGTGRIATLVGRYWAIARDTRWDWGQRAYDLFTSGTGEQAENALDAVARAYENSQTDEFIEPVSLIDPGDAADSRIKDNDSLIFFNFRADRAKEITRAFTEKDFSGFERKKKIALSHFVCMTRYDETFPLPVAFGPQHLDQIFGQVLSRNRISQLRIAETEKYAHVTYFFNGGDEKTFDLEERILIPSPRDVSTYDLKPEMSAEKVAEKACEQIRSGRFGFVVLNFANMDMVGHTGILDAAVKACETVDRCVRKVVEAIWETGGTAFVTADHGNCEQMKAEDGSAHTAHTLNPVCFILAGTDYKGRTLRNGILGDIAPTILQVLDIEPPSEMTGTSLLQTP